MTPDAFRSAHGDSTTWSAADFEGYEHMLEAASPVYAAAAASDRIIVGRHAEGSKVVADLALRPFMAGTTGSGKNPAVSVALVLQQIREQLAAARRKLVGMHLSRSQRREIADRIRELSEAERRLTA
ncbi:MULTISPECIES: hypothetical protein [Streptomyces]|nr:MULTISPECIES: hypothetical protein [Streptomyces]KOG73100.1 hypothetical protein ADK78_17755 [Kitasatospora aureofaciens]KEF04872.1 hypothetical protein DF17_21760 [Streptomyces rimosus]KOT38647.1 hypothetical protein ADK42_17035 [Streptomyces rimosus subsp. rimosus]KOT38747.1 hypothetical protein ADK84_16280 [Streptomyces sp. NRRL WC-3701]KOT60873.1 hypothetical protein ADK45_19090 [Streptomyces rimosus subsp. rimosus]